MHTYEQMHVVRHAIHLQHFVPVILNDAGQVFVKFITPGVEDQCGSHFRGENELNGNLKIGIGHYREINFPSTQGKEKINRFFWVFDGACRPGIFTVRAYGTLG